MENINRPHRLLLAGLNVCLLCIPLATAHAIQNTWPLDQGWYMQSSYLVENDGATLSSGAFTPRDWYPITLPTTALTALVKAGVYPDPYVGMNNMKIPDADQAFNQAQDLDRFSHLPNQRNPWRDPYWFWIRFICPADLDPNKNTSLHLGAINYRADVWLNGQLVAKSRDIVGMFSDWTLPLGATLHTTQPNTLAIRVHPLDTPGDPAPPQLKAFGPFETNGGITSSIAQNVTMHCAVGWDWMPAVRDRNLGLWRGVTLTQTGPVDLRPPQVVTTLTKDNKEAQVAFKVDLVNLTPSVQRGICRIDIAPPAPGGPVLHLKRPVLLDPHQTQTIQFDARTDPQLLLTEPQLWWPNGLGDQPLYGATLRFDGQKGTSDEETIRFGVRTVESRVTQVEGWARRDFFVNGQKVLLQGGAWVPDIMLNRGSEKCRHELRLLQQAHLNIVRIWGGGVTPPEVFFDTCDKLGLLVWHDFWITGDCQGTWGKGSQDYPFDAEVFLRHARRVVELYRHHPCLLVWTAGNEGYPRAEIYIPLRDQIVAELDGSRPFLPSSGFKEPPETWGLSWPDDAPAGTYSGGPYCWVDPCEYYRLVDAGKDWLFKNEVGIPSVPVFESLQKFIPDLTPEKGVPFPLNNTWGYHDACEGNGKYSLYDQALRQRYGEPKDVADYAYKAQLLNAESYRAIFEAVRHEPQRTAGVILWKANPAWPSVIWQLYDWYLCPHAGYYFTQKACEPIHVQLNLDDLSITAVNQTASTQTVVFAGTLYGQDMKHLDLQSSTFELPPFSATQLDHITLPEPYRHQICFVDLRLQDRHQQTVSENLYWIATRNNFKALADLPKATLKVSAKRTSVIKDEQVIEVQLSNPSKALAFFVRLSLHGPDNGPEILPSFWSDNYLTVPPGQSRTVSVQAADAAQPPLFLKLEGSNIQTHSISVP